MLFRFFGLICVVLFRFLTFGDARAAAFALASADGLDAALGLLRREALEAWRQRQRQPADAVLIHFDPSPGVFRSDGSRFVFRRPDGKALGIAGRDAVIAERKRRDGRVLVGCALCGIVQGKGRIAVEAGLQKGEGADLRLFLG